MSSSFELNGLEELNRKLSEFGQVGREMKKEVLMIAGKHMQEKLKDVTRGMDDHIETAENEKYGTLEENMKIRWKGDLVQVHTGKAYWSVFLEYGYPGYPAQPFMESTFRSTRDELERIIMHEAKRRLGLS
jgi:HK97 gp10 family phage protein